jgi:hypothetical protein
MREINLQKKTSSHPLPPTSLELDILKKNRGDVMQERKGKERKEYTEINKNLIIKKRQ